jgi:hypothetical protein
MAVMSELPPPTANREPLAKSAPATSASTNRGISAGSALPSASNITTTSPVTRANPAARALPWPRRTWWTTSMSGSTRRAVATVSSTEPPSTRTTWCTCGSSGRTTSRLRASFMAGTTMVIRGVRVRPRRRGVRVSTTMSGFLSTPGDEPDSDGTTASTS